MVGQTGQVLPGSAIFSNSAKILRGPRFVARSAKLDDRKVKDACEMIKAALPKWNLYSFVFDNVVAKGAVFRHDIVKYAIYA